MTVGSWYSIYLRGGQTWVALPAPRECWDRSARVEERLPHWRRREVSTDDQVECQSPLAQELCQLSCQVLGIQAFPTVWDSLKHCFQLVLPPPSLQMLLCISGPHASSPATQAGFRSVSRNRWVDQGCWRSGFQGNRAPKRSWSMASKQLASLSTYQSRCSHW